MARARRPGDPSLLRSVNYMQRRTKIVSTIGQPPRPRPTCKRSSKLGWTWPGSTSLTATTPSTEQSWPESDPPPNGWDPHLPCLQHLAGPAHTCPSDVGALTGPARHHGLGWPEGRVGFVFSGQSNCAKLITNPSGSEISKYRSPHSASISGVGERPFSTRSLRRLSTPLTRKITRTELFPVLLGTWRRLITLSPARIVVKGASVPPYETSSPSFW